MFGVILVIIGTIFLLKNMGLITGNVWNIVWPCLIIAIGLKLIFRKKFRSHDKFHKFGEHMEKFGEEMKKEFTEDKK